MGCFNFAMPLLSTLAALVIIVHTADENYDQDYRDIRPRSLDVGGPRIEKPWRNMQMAPIMTQSPPISQDDTWEERNLDQPLRRRRPGRKRKRRPTISDEDETMTQERYIYQDPSRPRRQENIDTPRRRRKKTDQQDSKENSRWTNEDTERRTRRGQRRKRPNLDKFPELSEFNGYRQHERWESGEAVDTMETRIPETHYKDYNLNKNEEKIDEVEFDKVEHDPELVDMITEKILDENGDDQQETIRANDDKSLSEFSSEIAMAPEVNINSSLSVMKDKLRDKYINSYKDVNVKKAKTKQSFIEYRSGLDKNVGIEKGLSKIRTLIKRDSLSKSSIIPLKEQSPLNPITLKSILKRSKGKSLSEILQQNNLTLADLLQGNEKALTLIKSEEFLSNRETNQNKLSEPFIESRPLDNINGISANKNEHESKGRESLDTETTTTTDTSTVVIERRPQNTITRRTESVLSQEAVSSEDPRNGTKHYIRRRYPAGVRKQVRMRLMTNNTFKGQLSRDLIAQSMIKYKNNRNVSRQRDWKEYMPSRLKKEMIKKQPIIEIDKDFDNITATTHTPPESTTQEMLETTTDPSAFNENTEYSIIIEMGTEASNTITDEIQTTTEIIEQIPSEDVVVSEKSPIKPIVSTSDLRRQVFNNRLKRKRQRQKVSSTEYPDPLQHVFGEASFVSASEFIAKTQTKTTNANDDNEFSTLEDFLTTESTQDTQKGYKSKKLPTTQYSIALTTQSTVTTEETAKIEIEEILNDSLTNAKLTEILKERNMTLNELVAHRERGSSNLHLADIFHNASREPNPPEPFLTKSLIEPISKETYPLRALLEANLHDAKTTTYDPNTPSNLNIPVVMDFGNNVNEIGENIGIISLFNNFSRDDNESVNESDILYRDTPVATANSKFIETARDGRSFNGEKTSVTWNDLIKLMQSNQRENTDNDKSFTTDNIPNTLKKNSVEEDIDGESILIFEDLKNLKSMNNKIDSDELLEINLYEKNESPQIPVAPSSPSNTKSVTVATISIIGLALILFLLTYAALKWKQQSRMFHKKHSSEDVSVPTPIFENRKTQKLNSSTRSKSPMLSTNIYTVEDSLDQRDGNESPEYMWDTLRKPYQ